MGKIKVSFYKTVNGRDQLKTVMYFDTMQQAMEYADEWESRTLDNYAVYG